MDKTYGLKRAGSVSIGVVVILLYAVFVTSVFSGFATYIVRSEWSASLSARGQAQTDVNSVILAVKQVPVVKDNLEGLFAEISAKDMELTEKQAEVDLATSSLGKVERRIETWAFQVLAELKGIAILYRETDRVLLMDTLNNADAPRLARAKEGLTTTAVLKLDTANNETARTSAAEIRLDEMKGDLEDLESQQSTMRYVLNEQARALTSIRNQSAALRLRVEQTERQLDELNMIAPAGSADWARFQALELRLPLIKDLFQRLVSFPTIFLTLIVTIAAGGLGTVVSFSRKYYGSSPDAEEPSLAHLFVNVGEGIAAALAIFLFSGAGMLALTQGAGSQSAVELSPYTVAFVAFVSGFMAEDAFGSIQNAGKRLFAQDAPKGNGQEDLWPDLDGDETPKS